MSSHTHAILRRQEREALIEDVKDFLRKDRSLTDWFKSFGKHSKTSVDKWGPGYYGGPGYSCGPYYIDITTEEIE